jgi:hypothetical protein
MNRKLKNKIKMLGIGAKDDKYYIKYARESWKVKFPLFPDENLVIHKMVGSPGTPYFICVKKDEKGKLEIFYTHAGAITAADKFINTVVEKAGLE